MTPPRWELFDNDELCELWDGLMVEDHVRQPLSEQHAPVAYRLAAEMYDEANHRGMVEADEARWERIL